MVFRPFKSIPVPLKSLPGDSQRRVRIPLSIGSLTDSLPKHLFIQNLQVDQHPSRASLFNHLLVLISITLSIERSLNNDVFACFEQISESVEVDGVCFDLVLFKDFFVGWVVNPVDTMPGEDNLVDGYFVEVGMGLSDGLDKGRFS